MARIIVGSYMIRYPLGGMLSTRLQYLVGFQRLGHEVYLVEKSGYEKACYDLSKDVMTDDPAYGIEVVNGLLSRFGLENRWCYVDARENYYGMSRAEVEAAFRSADVFVDLGAHGCWQEEAAKAGHRVLIDGEPAFRQMKMEKIVDAGRALPEYDSYYTCGQNIGTPETSAPDAGKPWRKLFHPVVVELFSQAPPNPEGSFTTIMNWQSYGRVEYEGTEYGHKDIEFMKFVDLPRRTAEPMDVAVYGKSVPRDRLVDAGWRLHDAHATTATFDSFADFVRRSKGEFSVAKNGFVATNSGWFSDRSAFYLAHGRPVVMQETGFSDHLPCGEGLFAVRDVGEAAAAIDRIRGDYPRHSARAREIAREFLDTSRVLKRLLDEIGV